MAMKEPISCYIVDDEIAAIENIQITLERYCPEIKINGCASTVLDAYEFLTQNETDILLLDIRLHNETGFDLLRKIKNFNGSIIFITAYDEYGIQAVKFSATDYLLKPIDTAEFVSAIQKASLKKQEYDNYEQIAFLIQSLESQRQTQRKIALPEISGIRYVLIKDIICCKSDNSYTTFQIQDSNSITVSKPISEYEEILEGYGFVRIHQSWLVNRDKIISYRKDDGGYLLMQNGHKVLISRHRKHLLKALFL